MQFTAHLDELENNHKIPNKKKGSKKTQSKNFAGEAHFKVDIEEEVAEPKKLEPKKKVIHEPVKKNQKKELEKNGTWQNTKDVLAKVLASVLIFIVGYIVMNWSALSIVLDNKIKELQGIDVSEPYKDLADKKKPVAETTLEISNNPEEQKKQIPALNLEVTPPDMRIIIPKIGSNVPVVPVPTENLIARDWGALENDIQSSLRDGVVHYPGTAYPDQIGNVVVTGHSSYFPWDPGRFKDVFALLHQVELKDKIVVFYEQKKYIYQVDEKKIVLPDKIDVLGPTDDSRLTLITCTPIGTNKKRLILRAVLIEGELADGTKVTVL